MNDETARHDRICAPLFATLQPGQLGAIAARAGVGKSTCLVCIALDELIRGEQVLHVSLDTPVDHVRASYDATIDALRDRDPASMPSSLRLEIERRRVIHSFLGGAFVPAKLREAFGFLAENMDFRPSTVVVDAFPFSSAPAGHVPELRSIVGDVGARLWMSALTSRSEGLDATTGLPESLSSLDEHLGVVVRMVPQGDEVSLQLLKHGDERVPRQLPDVLDPTTMLFVRGGKPTDKG